ncbi:MAG: HD domain-containing protein [Deltaproteobacteria bacterium]|nr:HD domain-containing protein [Deltaproteobacteria bacterium]
MARSERRFYDARLGEALHLAAEAFAHTERKGSGIPYLSHLLAVTTTVMEHGGSPDQCIAAVLHDYLEDIPGSSAHELAQRFGADVARMVLALSDATQNDLDAGGAKPPWAQRKQGYLAHLRHAPADVKLISAADKLHNAGSIVRDRAVIGDAIFDRFTPTLEQTLWYYNAVCDALAHGWSHTVLDELRRTVALLEG